MLSMVRRVGLGGVAAVVVLARPAGAQDVTFTPASEGLPGAAMIQTMTGWGGWAALVSCVAAVDTDAKEAARFFYDIGDPVLAGRYLDSLAEDLQDLEFLPEVRASGTDSDVVA